MCIYIYTTVIFIDYLHPNSFWILKLNCLASVRPWVWMMPRLNLRGRFVSGGPGGGLGEDRKDGALGGESMVLSMMLYGFLWCFILFFYGLL